MKRSDLLALAAGALGAAVWLAGIIIVVHFVRKYW